jgi:hypothetical protein
MAVQGKIKNAIINETNMAIYDNQLQVIKVFDSQTKSLLHTLKEASEF